MVDYPSVKLQVLDKSMARTTTLEAKVGTTIEYGSVFIKVQACRKSDPLDKPENASFLQIWEVPINSKKSEWLFSGWMFSSSPALSAMDHPIYDVWVLDCFDKDKKIAMKKMQSPTDTKKSTEVLEPKITIEGDDGEVEPVVATPEVSEEGVAPAEENINFE